MDTLTIAMDQSVTSYAHHFIPQTNKQERLVVLHHGHSCTFNDIPGDTDEGYGMQRTIYSLLSRGYSVLAVYMPYKATFFDINTCDVRTHDSLFDLQPSQGSSMKYFLEPVAVSLNYLRARYSTGDFPRYKQYDMIGLSGGGWTTTVYSAIDTRIKYSFPVAGSMPLYLRKGDEPGDKEQIYSDFYKIAGYLDLYVLGSAGTGRKQIQILNRWDDCCFGQAQHDAAQTRSTYDEAVRDYESRVQRILSSLGFDGGFRLHIDNKAPHHTISRQTIKTILRELDIDSPRERNGHSRP
ncbi:hypothetical protein [Nonomuraea turcica]|uniref:hypothetical protein n=1 Tax=Nonomuraea sp. G32 TaxID=3067274 RepID=UPI00273B6F90|nr:hypothetical protein [Nonomuraea sp. G32]MDP4511953.1 hypothetical protein [Nonomuraea sp. G32]